MRGCQWENLERRAPGRNRGELTGLSSKAAEGATRSHTAAVAGTQSGQR